VCVYYSICKLCICALAFGCTNIHFHLHYGVATITRLLKIIGLFCRIQSPLQSSFAKETYNCKEPTNRSHPIVGGGIKDMHWDKESEDCVFLVYLYINCACAHMVMCTNTYCHIHTPGKVHGRRFGW